MSSALIYSIQINIWITENGNEETKWLYILFAYYSTHLFIICIYIFLNIYVCVYVYGMGDGNAYMDHADNDAFRFFVAYSMLICITK